MVLACHTSQSVLFCVFDAVPRHVVLCRAMQINRSVPQHAVLCRTVLCCAVPCAGEDNKELWKAHDATELVASYKGPELPTLIDTGTADNFLEREVSGAGVSRRSVCACVWVGRGSLPSGASGLV